MPANSYIDFHTHYVPSKIDEKQFLVNMDNSAVEKCIILAVPDHERYAAKGLTGTNEVIAKLVCSHPDRLIGGVYIDPRATLDAQTIAKRYRDQGFPLVKLWPAHGYYLDDPRIYPVLEVIDQLKMGALFHSGYLGRLIDDEANLEKQACFNSAFGQPIHVDQPARLFPNIQFIIAHSGYPWALESLVMSSRHPNVYVDFSCRWGIDGFHLITSTTQPESIDWSKFLWATDSAGDFTEDIVAWKERFIKIKLDQKNTQNFFYENASGLLKKIV